MDAVFSNTPVVDPGELWLERVLVSPPGLRALEPRPQPVTVHTKPERVKLSRRELQIVRFIALGMRNFEIAERLGIGEQTVKNHLHKVFQKTGVRDRLDMALYAVFHGIY
jgi:DNA-binding NarL/FixJ family response regulator